MNHPPSIPDYTLLRPIGRGSYGEVWLARSVTGQYRALKVIYRNQFEDARPYEREFAGIKRFEPISRSNEGQVDILHVGRNDAGGYFYYVMELADDAGADAAGPAALDPARYAPKTLKAFLAARGRLEVRECIALGISLADGLAGLHGHGLVHRDIKPSNIIFVQGLPKLADIGLITASDATGSFVGTEGFVPREGPGLPPADIFALGKVLYEAATGRDRLEFPSLPEDLDQLEGRAELRELNEVLLKACEPDPRLRYRTASELRNDLELIRARKSVRRLRTLERAVRRGRKLALAGATITLLVGLGWYDSHRFNRFAASQLAAVYVKNGQERFDQSDWLGALPWFAAAADLEKPIAQREQSHLLRLANTEAWCPQMVALYTHSRPVRYAFFDGDAHQALLCEPGTVARIWDPLLDEPLTPPLQHGGQPFFACFSPDNRRVASLSRGDGAGWLWDCRTGQLLAGPIRHGKQTMALAFSTDANLLATAGEDGVARLWRAEDGKQTGVAFTNGAPIYSADFSPAGDRFLTLGGMEPTSAHIAVWDVQTGSLLRQGITKDGGISVAQFSADGGIFAGTASGEVHHLQFELRASNCWTQKLNQPIVHLALNRDGSRVLAASDWTAQLFDARTGAPVGQAHRSSGVIRSTEFSPSGQRYIIAGESRVAQMYDSSTGRPCAPPIKHAGEIYRAFFLRDGSGWVTASADGTVRRWQPSQGEQTQLSFSCDSDIKLVFPTPDSRALIILTEQGTVQRCLLAEAAPKAATNCCSLQNGVSAASLSADGRELVVATRRGDLIALSTPDFRCAGTNHFPGPPTGTICCNPNGQSAAFLDRDGAAWAWDWSSGSVERIENSGRGSHISFSGDGRLLAISTEKEVRLFRIHRASASPIGRIQHADRVWHVGFVPGASRLLVSSEDRVMRWWDGSTGKPLSAPLRGDGGINFATFSPDQMRVFTASVNYEAMIWSTRSGRPITPPFNPKAPVVQAVFSSDGHWVALITNDSTLQVWDATSGEPMTPSLPAAGKVGACQFTSDDRWLITTEAGRKVVARRFLLQALAREDTLARAALLSGQRVDGHGFLTRLDAFENARLVSRTLNHHNNLK